MGSHTLLQGIFPIQGSNPGLPHCRQILCHLSYPRSPSVGGWFKTKSSVFFRGEHADCPYCSIIPSVTSIQILNYCSMPMWVIWRALSPCLPPTDVEVLDVEALVLVLLATSGIRHQHDGSSSAALCGIRLSHGTHMYL